MTMLPLEQGHMVSVLKAALDEIVERSLKRGGNLGRGKRQAEKIRAWYVGRSTAASLHCPRFGSGAGSFADGRTDQRT